jgi:hypothetical protein
MEFRGRTVALIAAGSLAAGVVGTEVYANSGTNIEALPVCEHVLGPGESLVPISTEELGKKAVKACRTDTHTFRIKSPNQKTG